MKTIVKHSAIIAGFAIPFLIFIVTRVAPWNFKDGSIDPIISFGRDFVLSMLPGALLWILLEIGDVRANLQANSLAARRLGAEDVSSEIEAINAAMARIAKLDSAHLQAGAADAIRAARVQLARIADGVLPLSAETDLARLPIKLAQDVRETLDATMVWSDTRLKGRLGEAYARTYEQAVKSRGVRVRRLYVFDAIDAVPADALERMRREAAWAGVEARIIAASDWRRSDKGGLARPVDFGLWDKSAVWRYEPTASGAHAAELIAGDDNIDPYAKAFEANWAVAAPAPV